MAGRKSDFTLTKLDDLFSTQEQRDEEKLSKIRDIPLTEIDDFPDHPFKVRDDEDTAPAAAMPRLDDEIRRVRHQVEKTPDLVLGFDAADQLGGGHAVPDRKLFGPELVVHIRIIRATIVAHDVSVIALVHPEHPGPAQTPRGNNARQRQPEPFHFFTSG